MFIRSRSTISVTLTNLAESRAGGEVQRRKTLETGRPACVLAVYERWCISCDPLVQYAYGAVLESEKLKLWDRLILHVLGVSWTNNLCHGTRQSFWELVAHGLRCRCHRGYNCDRVGLRPHRLAAGQIQAIHRDLHLLVVHLDQ